VPTRPHLAAIVGRTDSPAATQSTTRVLRSLRDSRVVVAAKPRKACTTPRSKTKRLARLPLGLQPGPARDERWRILGALTCARARDGARFHLQRAYVALPTRALVLEEAGI
jgi:hypothetical protein